MKIKQTIYDYGKQKKKQIVVGFLVEDYERWKLEKLSDNEKHEYALADANCVIFDSIKDFFGELNDDCVDIDNNYFYSIFV